MSRSVTTSHGAAWSTRTPTMSWRPVASFERMTTLVTRGDGSPGQAGGAAASPSLRPFAAIMLCFAVWVTVAPYAGEQLGFEVNTRAVVELVDHVLPGAVVIAVALAWLVADRLALPAALVAVLAGFWTSGTHVPLLAQAARDEVGLGSALWHALPAFAVFLLATAASVLVVADRRSGGR